MGQERLNLRYPSIHDLLPRPHAVKLDKLCYPIAVAAFRVDRIMLPARTIRTSSKNRWPPKFPSSVIIQRHLDDIARKSGQYQPIMANLPDNPVTARLSGEFARKAV
jgi:hypothetical protein